MNVFSDNRGHSKARISKGRGVLPDGHRRGRGEVEEPDDRHRARISLRLKPRIWHERQLQN